ncbi:MAG: RelA/SpoT domain-containing protein [Alphaproteobacteria bacterium]|nr:RelA/SpoT domain-containing protein [Alphaproteobacteria bacterium]
MTTKDKRLIFPKYTKNRVRSAGNKVRTNSITKADEMIIENWRESHNHILNSWLVTLVNRIKRNDVSAITGQRLKRKNTIYEKLCRLGTSRMSLERMYDIAGCRMVFENLKDLHNFRKAFIRDSRFYHQRKYQKDYIETPKQSGYRGIHDIYAYQSDPRRSKNWDGLFVEIQYRTEHQHAWATAVEVADIIKKSRTKFSDVADAEQNLFFQYSSEIIARAYENQKSCCPLLSDKELVDNFKSLEQKLKLLATLKAIKVIHKDIIKDKRIRAIIIRLHIANSNPEVEIIHFKNLTEASRKYFELEKQYSSDNIVLVKADQTNFLNSIKKVFRNYFTDAGDFIKYIEDGLLALTEGRILFNSNLKKTKKGKQLPLFPDL